MLAPDYDVIKEIPGYKVILKSVLKIQIQQLVEQLASSTDEESVILIASVADGTLSHFGSESGKGFLEDCEDIKSQFLEFCLEKHHRKKQEVKERQEACLERFGRPRSPYGAAKSPRFASPRVRHEPYPISRASRMKRTSLNFDPGKGPFQGPSKSQTAMRSPGANKQDGQVIKIEPEDENVASNQRECDTQTQEKFESSSQSPSYAINALSVKSESGEKDDNGQSETSNLTILNEPLAEGLSLDADLSNLISGNNQQQSSETSDMDPNVSVKLEALTENEMELEITGVELGRPALPQDNLDPNVSMGMNYDPTGATGNQENMMAQGYRSSFRGVQQQIETFGTYIPVAVYAKAPLQKRVFMCKYCPKMLQSASKLQRLLRMHTGEKPFKCAHCYYSAAYKSNLKAHVKKYHLNAE